MPRRGRRLHRARPGGAESRGGKTERCALEDREKRRRWGVEGIRKGRSPELVFRGGRLKLRLQLQRSRYRVQSLEFETQLRR